MKILNFWTYDKLEKKFTLNVGFFLRFLCKWAPGCIYHVLNARQIYLDLVIWKEKIEPTYIEVTVTKMHCSDRTLYGQHLKIFHCRRQDRSPVVSSRICSCHFLDGNRNNGPTIFNRNADKLLTFSSPEKRKKKKKTLYVFVVRIMMKYSVNSFQK